MQTTDFEKVTFLLPRRERSALEAIAAASERNLSQLLRLACRNLLDGQKATIASGTTHRRNPFLSNGGRGEAA